MPIAICSFASSRRLRASLRLTAGYTPRERSFSFPPKRCLSRHHLPPLEVTSRKRPPPSNSLAGLSCGLAERIAVSVNAMGVTSFGGSRVTPRVTPAGGRYLYAFCSIVDKRKGQNPYFSMDFGLSWSLLDHQMVEAGGIEPPSESSLTGTSPGAVCYLPSRNPPGTNTLRELVAS